MTGTERTLFEEVHTLRLRSTSSNGKDRVKSHPWSRSGRCGDWRTGIRKLKSDGRLRLGPLVQSSMVEFSGRSWFDPSRFGNAWLQVALVW